MRLIIEARLEGGETSETEATTVVRAIHAAIPREQGNEQPLGPETLCAFSSTPNLLISSIVISSA